PRPLMRAVEEAEVLDGFGKRATEMVVTRRLNGEAASLGVAALDPEGLATGKARGIEHRHEAEPPQVAVAGVDRRQARQLPVEDQREAVPRSPILGVVDKLTEYPVA